MLKAAAVVILGVASALAHASGAPPVKIAEGTEAYPLLSSDVINAFFADPTGKYIANDNGVSGILHMPVSQAVAQRDGSTIEYRTPAQDLIDEIFDRLSRNPGFLNRFPDLKKWDIQGLKNTFGISLTEACKVRGLAPEKCVTSGWQINLLGKKLGLMVVQSNPLDFDSWTNAPYGETMLILPEAALRARDPLLLIQSYLHEVAIQYDAKSYLMSSLGDTGMRTFDIRDLQALSDLSFVQALRTSRAFRFEAEVLRSDMETYALPQATRDFYMPFYNWNLKVCVDTLDRLAHFRGNGLTDYERSFLKRSMQVNGQSTSICEFATEVDLSGSSMLDGSGPRPRIGAWD